VTDADVDRAAAAAIGAAAARAAVDDHALEASWHDRPGWLGFFTTVDHKRLGIRYIVTSFVFFFAAGAQALLMRTQLATAEADVVAPEAFNELFTMHGTTMIFLFNTPVLAGFANYLLPLHLGTRDLAFPRLNAFSYWVFLFSGLFLYAGYLIDAPPDAGWFAYVPLADRDYSPGVGLELWALAVVFVGISTTAGAINFIVTIFKLRAPGMTFNRMPLFAWSVLAMAVMVIFAVPAVTLSAALLAADRLFDTAFFHPGRGGSVLLYQHLFWFWGHPEVYILMLPAVGMASTIIGVFSRQRFVGYLWAAAAFVAIAFISFGVWIHHMFTTGVPDLAMAVFSAASLIIVIPSGVLYATWIATMINGRVELATPMLFMGGFLVILLLGGVTGAMVSVMPFDWQAHDSYFIVAHLHYVLNGGVVFPIFGALYYWWPKMTGRLFAARTAKLSFWTMFVGFNLTFFPMHVLGLLGMPRRVYTYREGLGWETLNTLATIGGFLFGAGALLTVAVLGQSRRRGEPAPANPWGADTLEWAAASPPPEYNFAAIPLVRSRHPLWDAAPLELAGDGEAAHGVDRTGALARATPVLSGMETEPEGELAIPRPSWRPVAVALAIAMVFVGLLIEAVVVGAAAAIAVLVGVVAWAWYTGDDLE